MILLIKGEPLGGKGLTGPVCLSLFLNPFPPTPGGKGFLSGVQKHFSGFGIKLEKQTLFTNTKVLKFILNTYTCFTSSSLFFFFFFCFSSSFFFLIFVLRT